MRDPLATTFAALISTTNQQAIDVLVHALDVSDHAVRAQAVAALLRRGGSRGPLEIIRRFDALTPEMRSVLDKQARSLSNIFRQCLLHGDAELRQNALKMIRLTERFDQIATLVEILVGNYPDFHDEAACALRDLAVALYEHITSTEPTPGDIRIGNGSHVRHLALTSLCDACERFDRLAQPEIVVEATMILGDIDHFAVKKVLAQADPRCREIAGELLVTSRHPGVMQLVCDSMSKNYPSLKAFEALQVRKDSAFICHLLQWFPKRPTQIQQKNFRQIEAMAWLTPDEPAFRSVPDGLQESLVALITATGLPRQQKTTLREWLVRHGSPQGRMAAGDILGALDQDTVHEILFDGLDSDDPEIQAWATGQLRAHGIPQAFELLIERLDSPLPAVCEAARHELEGFNLERMLGLFEQLDSPTCRRAGTLIQKIDPNVVLKLRREMASPIRPRRIRAARAAVALGMQNDVLGAVVAMLDDGDSLVRRTGAEVLGTMSGLEATLALQNALDDPSPRVRDAVRRALEQTHQLQT